MELGLEGKVVLVTGGSKGIGLACALGFAAEGARIAICSRSRENIDKASAKLNEVFGAVADPDRFREDFKKLSKRHHAYKLA